MEQLRDGDTVAICINALSVIAAFDDAIGCEHLAATGSYGAFDEPASVEIARKALNEIIRDRRL
jgi:hypothetical protein